MLAQASLAEAASLLHELGARLGLEPAVDWAPREELELLSWSEATWRADRLERLDLVLLESIVRVYGDTLSCRFMAGSRELSVGPGLTQADLAAFRLWVAKRGTVEVILEIHKSRLAARLLGDLPHCQARFYFFSSRFEAWLANSTRHLEDRLWVDEFASKRVILLMDRNLLLDGRCLAVVGGRHLDAVASVLPVTPLDVKALREAYEAGRRATHWETEYLRHVMPVHLALKGTAAPGDGIARHLGIHLVNTMLLYAADRTQGQGESCCSTFAPAQESVEIPHAIAGSLPLASFDVEGARELFFLCQWMDDPQRGKDKLALLRVRMVSMLRAVPRDERWVRMVRYVGALKQDFDWSWQAFIRGTVEEYDKDVRDFEKYVRDSATAFADQTTKMVEGLNSAMLAAVGALVGSFLAAIFKDTFNPGVFRFGMLAYAAYLVVFGLGTSLRSQERRFDLLTDQVEAQKAACSRILAADQIARIHDAPIGKARQFFQDSLRSSRRAYLGVAVVAVLLAVLVPCGMPVEVKPAASATPSAQASLHPSPSTNPPLENPTPAPSGSPSASLPVLPTAGAADGTPGVPAIPRHQP